MANFEINASFSGLTAAARQIRNLAGSQFLNIVQGIIEDCLNTVLLPEIQDYVENTPDGRGLPIEWQGDLRESLEFRTFRRGFFIESELGAIDYARYFILGREPGEDYDIRSSVDQEPEFQRLLAWAEDKIGAEDPRALAWSIRQKILNEGLQDGDTLPRNFIEPVVSTNLESFRAAVEAKLLAAVESLGG